MSPINDICKYLNISNDEILIDDVDIDSPPNSINSKYLEGYKSDVSDTSSSYKSDSDSDSDYDFRSLRIKPLNSLTRSDVSLILDFVAKIVDLMCRLTCNLRSNKEEIDIYIDDTRELTEVLQHPPEKYSLMKDKACGEILINAQTMKDNISKDLKFT